MGRSLGGIALRSFNDCLILLVAKSASEMWKKMPILPLWAHSGHRADIGCCGGCCRLLRFRRTDEKDTEPPHAPNDLLTLLEQPWWPTLGMRCFKKSLRKVDSRPRIIRCERKNQRGSEIVLLGLVIHGLLHRASFQLRTSICCTPAKREELTFRQISGLSWVGLTMFAQESVQAHWLHTDWKIFKMRRDKTAIYRLIHIINHY